MGPFYEFTSSQGDYLFGLQPRLSNDFVKISLGFKALA
jgi:hypothetical protein